MSTHTPECQNALAQFLAAPTDSAVYSIAHFVEDHPAGEGLDLLLRIIWDDAPGTPEFIAAQRMLPSVLAEAVQS